MNYDELSKQLTVYNTLRKLYICISIMSDVCIFVYLYVRLV